MGISSRYSLLTTDSRSTMWVNLHFLMEQYLKLDILMGCVQLWPQVTAIIVPQVINEFHLTSSRQKTYLTLSQNSMLAIIQSWTQHSKSCVVGLLVGAITFGTFPLQVHYCFDLWSLTVSRLYIGYHWTKVDLQGTRNCAIVVTNSLILDGRSIWPCWLRVCQNWMDIKNIVN